jgi:hypothetical protein
MTLRKRENTANWKSRHSIASGELALQDVMDLLKDTTE